MKVILNAVDYDPDSVDLAELYPGHREIEIDELTIRAAFDSGIPASLDVTRCRPITLTRSREPTSIVSSTPSRRRVSSSFITTPQAARLAH